MSEGCWGLNKSLDVHGTSNNSFSVPFDSLAPARLALRANLRLLYLKGPAFSIVVNHAESWFKNPQGCGKIHAMFGHVGRFFDRVEFELYASNVCRMDSHINPPSGGLSLGSDGPTGIAPREPSTPPDVRFSASGG
jgi:hypothetical protein